MRCTGATERLQCSDGSGWFVGIHALDGIDREHDGVVLDLSHACLLPIVQALAGSRKRTIAGHLATRVDGLANLVASAKQRVGQIWLAAQ
jgi:hypothetical protein